MRQVRVIQKNGLFYPQVKKLFFFWCNDYEQGYSVNYAAKEYAIDRAKHLAKQDEAVVVWDNDDTSPV